MSKDIEKLNKLAARALGKKKASGSSSKSKYPIVPHRMVALGEHVNRDDLTLSPAGIVERALQLLPTIKELSSTRGVFPDPLEMVTHEIFQHHSIDIRHDPNMEKARTYCEHMTRTMLGRPWITGDSSASIFRNEWRKVLKAALEELKDVAPLRY